MATEIRPIREEDIESFRDAVDVVARERKYLYMTEAPPLDDMRTLVRANIQTASPHLVLVDGAKVAGWCNISSLGRAVQSHVGGVAMGLRPEWRDTGWGTRLMQKSLTASRAFGFTRVELSVYTSNPRAAALYRKLGFVEEGIKRRSVCIDGTYFDEILMARLEA